MNILKCGKMVYDCLNYKTKSILCSHVIATAEKINGLMSLLDWYKCTEQEPKLSRSCDIPKNPGNKPGQKKKLSSKSCSKAVTRSKLMLPGTCTDQL